MSDRTFSEPVGDLLAAVLEALDIPHPTTIGDVETHDRPLNERAMHASIALRSVLAETPLVDIEWTTAYLRERLAQRPPTGYRHSRTESAEAGR